jgi:hypothetical protein
MNIGDFTTIFRSMRFDFATEKIVQKQIEDRLKELNIVHEREKRLDKDNIPDFFIDGLCIEVKVKGSAKSIYRQLVRYAEFREVVAIVLITNKAIRLPFVLNDKPASVLKMGTAWL